MLALIKINNKTKRRVLLGAVFVLLLSVTGGGTLAYFSSVDTANNVITSGNVDIRIMEEAKDGLPFPANGISVMSVDINAISEHETAETEPESTQAKLEGNTIPSEETPQTPAMGEKIILPDIM